MGVAEELPEAVVARLRAVCLERLAQVEASWVTFVGAHRDAAVAEQLQRVVHTLKGDARGLGLHEVSTLCERIEDVIPVAQSCRVVSEEIDLVTTMAMQLVGMLLRSKPGAAVAGIDLPGFVRHMDAALADARASDAGDDLIEPPPPSSVTRMVEESAERVAVVTRRRLAAAATQVFLVQHALDEPLRSRLAAVWASLSGEVRRLDAVGLASLFQRHGAAVRDLAAAEGKEVSVELRLGSVRSSPEVAEALDVGLLHVVCNAVAHGIELPGERLRARKPRRGTVEVSARAEAQVVEVVVEDDGRGIDLEAVKRRAVERRLMPAHATTPPNAAIIDEVLFASGFSTVEHVSGISGRGVGLGAARDALSRVGGTISLEPRAGGGTRLTMRAPHARSRIEVHVFGGAMRDLTFAIPTTWALSSTSPPSSRAAVDPLRLLDLDALHLPVKTTETTARAVELCFRNGDRAIRLLATSTPTRALADRLCVTDEGELAEVVCLGEARAILLRPERLLAEHGAS